MNGANTNEVKRHTLSVMVDNEPGVLARVSGLISGRGFNIDSLSVAETIDPQVSLITLVTAGSPSIIEQIIKQLRKLINVIKVVDLTETEFVERQLALIKVKTDLKTRAEVLRIVDIFRAKIVDVGARFYTLEVTGGEGKIKAILELLANFGVEEIVCTGRIAIARSKK
ncbi:MAG: acetolactate synthase small subunit [Pseudomonadota bacterium]